MVRRRLPDLGVHQVPVGVSMGWTTMSIWQLLQIVLKVTDMFLPRDIWKALVIFITPLTADEAQTLSSAGLLVVSICVGANTVSAFRCG